MGSAPASASFAPASQAPFPTATSMVATPGLQSANSMVATPQFQFYPGTSPEAQSLVPPTQAAYEPTATMPTEPIPEPVPPPVEPAAAPPAKKPSSKKDSKKDSSKKTSTKKKKGCC